MARVKDYETVECNGCGNDRKIAGLKKCFCCSEWFCSDCMNGSVCCFCDEALGEEEYEEKNYQ